MHFFTYSQSALAFAGRLSPSETRVFVPYMADPRESTMTFLEVLSREDLSENLQVCGAVEGGGDLM